MQGVGVGLSALILGCLVLGCRAGGDEGDAVELWAMGREGEVLERLVRDYQRDEPAARVRVQQIPWSAAHEKLLTAYVGGAMPDLFQLGNTWIAEFVALGALEPLDARIAASTALPREDYFPGVLDAVSIEGQTWAIPWYVDTRILFYRADRLGPAAPPRSWEGWLEALARLQAQAGPDRHALFLSTTGWELPVILAWQRGGELLRDGDRYGNFRSAPVRDALAFYLDLFQRGLAPRAGEAALANLYLDFATGWFSVFVSGPWSVGELEERLPAALAEAWSTAPMPGAGDGAPGVSLAGGASLALLRGSPRQAAAWRFVEWLSAPARQLEFQRLTGDLPPRRSAWADAGLSGDPRVAAFRAQLAHLRATPRIPEWERIAARIGYWADAAIRGDLPLDAALARLDADVDAILAKRRWLLARRAAP